MKVVILAAGKGKRMGEITQEIPKPMVQVRDKPVLEHIIVGLRDFTKAKDFFIVTGHCAEMIEDHFGNGSSFGISCAYGRQMIQDGTGKAPELAKDWAGNENFFLTYGDVLIDPRDYAGMAENFSADGLISVIKGEDTRHGGAVVFDEDFFLTDLVEKAGPGAVDSPWYNAGIYIFPPKLFEFTHQLKKSPRGEYELTDAIHHMAADGLKIQGHQIQHHWVDVRDPEVLAKLNR